MEEKGRNVGSYRNLGFFSVLQDRCPCQFFEGKTWDTLLIQMNMFLQRHSAREI